MDDCTPKSASHSGGQRREIHHKDPLKEYEVMERQKRIHGGERRRLGAGPPTGEVFVEYHIVAAVICWRKLDMVTMIDRAEYSYKADAHILRRVVC